MGRLLLQFAANLIYSEAAARPQLRLQHVLYLRNINNIWMALTKSLDIKTIKFYNSRKVYDQVQLRVVLKLQFAAYRIINIKFRSKGRNHRLLPRDFFFFIKLGFVARVVFA